MASPTVPLALLGQLDPAVMSWTIPAGTNPRAARRYSRRSASCCPADALALARSAAAAVDGPCPTPSGRFERRGERISRDAWDLRAVPSYLDLEFRVVDNATRSSAMIAIRRVWRYSAAREAVGHGAPGTLRAHRLTSWESRRCRPRCDRRRRAPAPRVRRSSMRNRRRRAPLESAAAGATATREGSAGLRRSCAPRSASSAAAGAIDQRRQVALCPRRGVRLTDRWIPRPGTFTSRPRRAHRSCPALAQLGRVAQRSPASSTGAARAWRAPESRAASGRRRCQSQLAHVAPPI
jgi:hypothetical protein